MKKIYSTLIVLTLSFSFLLGQENESKVSTEKFKVNSQRRLSKQIDKLELYKNSFTGICIYDFNEGEFVFEYNADKYFTPASNLKILTYFAAEKSLKDQIPLAYYTEKEDSLIFWGSAAPSNLSSECEDSTLIEFLKKSDRKIYFSQDNFLDSPFGEGWAWDDYSYSFSKENSPLQLFSNSVKVTVFDDATYSVEPEAYRDSIEAKIANGYRTRLKRERLRNKFLLTIGSQRDSIELESPILIRNKEIINLLSSSSSKEIEQISRPILDTDSIITLYGSSKDSLLKKMMHKSDNFIAESLIFLSADNLNQRDSLSRKKQIKALKETYFDFLSADLKWVDGSGLSRYNLISPKDLVEVLIKIRQNALAKYGSMNRVFELFAEPGKEGTLKDRFPDLQGKIFAKTGSLSNNNNLSGYLITKSNKLLIFSFMNNHYLEKTKEIQEQSDRILKDFFLYYK